MHALLFLFVVTVVNVSCDVIHGGDGDCQESPWLCRQLAEMRRVMAEQHRIIQQQNKQIDEQSSVIVDLSSRVDEQSSAIVQLHTNDAKHATLIQKLQEELVTLKTPKKNEKNGVDSVHETSVTSNDEQHDVAPRSDDGGPLEAVVNQMSQQLTTVSADVQTLKNTDQVLQNVNKQQDLNIQDARTSTFVHWGSSLCPSDARLVYSGVMGGSSYTQSGGGSNYLCLTMSPVFSSHANPGQQAFLYGSEYQTFNDAHHDKDPVCAVCRSSHSTTIMIPGTNVCTPGWTKQYDGFLMAEREDHSSAEFICVDSAMEGRPGSDANQDGRLLYFTVTQCGSLPCGPYAHNKIMTCVVCSM